MINQTWFRALLLVVLTFSAYSFMLGAPFRTLDDQTSIVNNPLIRSFEHIPELFKQGYFKDQSYYRPLVNLSYLLEFQCFKLNPFFYHLDNVTLHIANAFLVWMLAGLLLGNTGLAFITALLFAIHPIHTEAVNSIAGRSILMGAFFVLLAFILFIRYDTERKKRFLGLSLGVFALGLLCKESVAVLPGVIFVYLWLKKRPVLGIWPFAVAIAGYLKLRAILGITQTFPWNNLQERVWGFVTFLKSALVDLRLLVLPVDLHFDRSEPMFLSFADTGFWLTLAIWAGIIGWLWMKRKTITGTTALCLGWLVLEMFPVSQVVTTIGVGPGVISTAEHFLYLASVPVLIIMVEAGWKLWQINQRSKSISDILIKAIVAAFMLFLVIMNVKANVLANDEIAMMEHSLKISPRNARLHSSTGLAYAQQGEFVKAQEHFAFAIREDFMNPRYRISLAQSICDQGRYEECVRLYEEIDNPGKLSRLLEANKQAARRNLEAHAQILPQ